MNESISIVESLIEALSRLNFRMHRKDFIVTWEKSYDDIMATLLLAEILRELYRDNISLRVFQSGLGISLFRDNSTRTRLAFSSACDLLGLLHQEIDEKKSQISHGETVRETANMISFLSEVIGIRDDMYIGRGDRFMREVADALDDGFANEVLNQRPVIINLQSDLDHPTQILSDLLHLKYNFGGIEELRNKKIVMSWAYSPSYGKPLSVPQGVIAMMSRLGMNVVLAHPEGYELVPEIIEKVKGFAKESGGSFTIMNDMEEAFKDAHVVYPKSWAPLSIMQQRTELVRQSDHVGLVNLEKMCLEQNIKHKNWVCNEKLMKTTSMGKALYLHCLPADIQGLNCSEGEVTRDVFEKYRLQTYKEARYKTFIIASMVILCRFRDPVLLVEKISRIKNNRAG